MINILIIEDDHAISNLIRLNLSARGYNCTVVDDGLSAADLLEENTMFDLILLDIMLPNIDGYELMEYIKPLGIPVIFLTAKGGLDDRVKGLTSGAEDYIVKPFEIIELLARINIVLRRYNKTDSIIKFMDITIDSENRIIKKDGEEINLTPLEFDLFLLLARNMNTTLFRDTIYEKVWGKSDVGDTRTLDLHIRRLRSKLGLSRELKTIYGTGYRLDKPEEHNEI